MFIRITLLFSQSLLRSTSLTYNRYLNISRKQIHKNVDFFCSEVEYWDTLLILMVKDKCKEFTST